MKPEWSWDKRHGIGYLLLSKKKSPKEKVRTVPNDFSNCEIILDYGEDGRVLGIEVMM